MCGARPVSQCAIGVTMMVGTASGPFSGPVGDGPVRDDQGGTHNEVGQVIGPVVQARSVDGGVHVHQPRWAPVVPRQLPASVRHFTGRIDELASLSGLLDSAAAGRTVVISAIYGTAGIGKTALAVFWAHQVAQWFPDGQLYVNLRGFDPTGSPVSPAAAIRGFLDAFAVPVERIPPSLEAQTALYRSLLAKRRVLVVLDNARNVDQVRSLLPGSPNCLVVVTSRSRLTGLIVTEGAAALPLELLTPDVAGELLARHLGAERIADEPEAVSELIKLCARLPLALAITGARASEHPDFPLALLVAQLRGERGRLDALDGGDPTTNVRAVFSLSYRYLSTGAARMFRLLGVHPGPDISLPAAASLAGVPRQQAREVLVELARSRMITEHAPGRFMFHDLLRAYATDHGWSADGDTERLAAVHRVLDHYLHSAHTAALLLHPIRSPLTLAPAQPDVAPENLADDGQARAWFEAEHPVLLAAITQAVDTEFDVHAWQLPWALATFLDRQGYWQEWAATQRTALAAARRLGDLAGEACVHRLLGRAYLRLGSAEEARVHLGHSCDCYQQLGDHIGQALAYYDLASAFGRLGRDDEALDHVRQAFELYQAAGHPVGQTRALSAIGWYHAQLGDHRQALTCCEQAITLCRELGDRLCEAGTWDSLGYAHQHLGDHDQAFACYRRAADLWQEFGNRYHQAVTLTHIGDNHHTVGDHDAAYQAWQQALAILDDLQHTDADQVRAKLHQLGTSGLGCL
jgi:tetratricopeptide (TPR) repeat protein